MGESKLVFLSFETKYFAAKIGPSIKLKLLKKYKNTKTTAILQNIANFPSQFKVFVFDLQSQNF